MRLFLILTVLFFSSLVYAGDGFYMQYGTKPSSTDTDEKAKVSSNDSTAGYLNGKLIAGTGITLTENNDGGNETLTITSTVSGGGGSSSPGGSDQQIQYNDGGNFGGDSGLTYHLTDNTISLAGMITTNTVLSSRIYGDDSIGSNSITGNTVSGNTIQAEKSIQIDLSGGTTPVNIGQLTMRTNDVISNINLMKWSNVFDNSAGTSHYRARGTMTAELAVQNNDALRTDDAWGFDGTTWNYGAYIEYDVDGVVSAGKVPTRIDFYTTDSNGNTLKQATLDSKSNFTVNTGTITGNTVSGNTVNVDGVLNVQSQQWNIGNKIDGTQILVDTVGATQLASTTVNAGSYTSTNLTVDADGRITTASNGSGGGSISSSVVFFFDGGGSQIATDSTVWIRMPRACTITEWDILGYSTGSTVVSIYRSTYASFDPIASQTIISGTEKPTLTNAMRNQDQNLTTWATSIAVGDYIHANIDSVDTITYLTVVLSYTI